MMGYNDVSRGVAVGIATLSAALGTSNPPRGAAGIAVEGDRVRRVGLSGLVRRVGVSGAPSGGCRCPGSPSVVGQGQPPPESL